MGGNYDIGLRVLSCEKCGAPVEAPTAGGSVDCAYCGVSMVLGQRKLDPVRSADGLEGDARIAKLRLQSGRPLPDNPYSTARPPPGCEGLTRSGQLPVIEQLAQRFREAIALVRVDPSPDHQRLLWWCASMLNQGYGMHGKHLERRAVLERAIEEIGAPGFRHMLFINLAGAAAREGEIAAAREWLDRCDPAPGDILLDSGYRIGLASVLVREGDAAGALEAVGRTKDAVPEAHQYRMMFAIYRIHGLEALGRPADAMAAARAIAADPEIGALVAEALELNDLAPKTRAALQSPPAAQPTPLQSAAQPVAATPSGAPNVGLLVAVILLVVAGLAVALVVTLVR